VERQFENATQYVDQLETDSSDGHSLHGLIFHRPRSRAIGTARLILPKGNVATLPVQSVLGKLGIDANSFFPLEQTAEVSRFAISREIRRRSSDDRFGVEDKQMDPGAECRSNLPCLGLVQVLVRMSISRGISYWAALMEPKLFRMLGAMGIRFNSIGPLISHHGIRQPSFCHVPTMLEQLFCEKPDNWDIVTNGGTLSYPNATKGDLKKSSPFVHINSLQLDAHLFARTLPLLIWPLRSCQKNTSQ
jgi:N-acyl amino acid synthase of PEP-CTERM/exosortase system